MLLSVTVVVLLASCGEPSSNESLPAGQRMLLSASNDLDVIHYGYIDGVRYEASVGPNDLREADTVESAMPPSDAADLAEPALSAVGENPDDFTVCRADLTRHKHVDRYYYIVAFCDEEEPFSVGFRVPVLLSGQYVQPEVADDQS